MAARILAFASPGEVRAVVEEDGLLLDVAIHRPGRPDGVGDRYLGRVIARVPAMAGAFLAVGDMEGFLPDSAGAAGLTAGALAVVEVTRAAQGGKGPRLRVADGVAPPAGARPGALLLRGSGAAERLATLHPGAPVLVASPGLAAALRPALGDRVTVDRELDQPDWDALAAMEASLPGGMRASFHPTPALVAVDVDGGRATTDRRPKPAAQLAMNRAALPELARQLRLRNLSGAILLDLAGLAPARREALGPDLAACLANDPLRPRLLGFTRLGLAEIVRPRVHPPLHELLRGSHAAGLAALRAAAQEAAAGPGRNPAIRAAPDVVAAAQGDAVAVAEYARETGATPVLRSDTSLPPGHWRIDPA